MFTFNVKVVDGEPYNDGKQNTALHKPICRLRDEAFLATLIIFNTSTKFQGIVYRMNK